MPSSSASRVLLIGARAAGKSTVGPLLAERLGLEFLDCDAEVERVEGRSIAALFRDACLRDAEQRALARLLSRRAGVVAAGGGAVLWSGLAGAARAWTVVWLRAPADELARRMRKDPAERPSLTGRPAAEEIADVLRDREPLYRALATFDVETMQRTAPEVTASIEKLLRGDDNRNAPNAD
ncbi:MAG: AAA family ATPase [Planctomycetota bacterium]|nr:AAA family ATPase [Planctomycetota bacterium]